MGALPSGGERWLLRLAAAGAALLLTSGCSQVTTPTETTTAPSTSPTAVTSAPVEPAVVRSARLGDAQAVGRMLREGAEVDDTDGAGRTGLRTAVEEGDGGPGYVDTVRLLVASGAAVPSSLAEEATVRGQDAVANTLTAVSAAPPDPPGTLLAAAAPGMPIWPRRRCARGPARRFGTLGSARRCCWR